MLHMDDQVTRLTVVVVCAKECFPHTSVTGDFGLNGASCLHYELLVCMLEPT